MKILLVLFSAIIIVSCSKEKLTGPPTEYPAADHHKWPRYWWDDSTAAKTYYNPPTTQGK
jgi:hypothetical protein